MKRNAVTVYGFVFDSQLVRLHRSFDVRAPAVDAERFASVPDDKAFPIPFHGNFVNDETVDIAAKMTVEDTLQKSLYFALVTLNFKFDPAIDQISDTANHLVASGDRPDRKPETHALNAALIKNLLRDHADTGGPPMCWSLRSS